MMRSSLLLLLPLAALGISPAAAQEEVERIEIVRGERANPGARGWLGISFQQPREDGAGPVVVEEVFPGSPAQRAGVQEGDTLLRLDGKAARMEMVRALRLAPGDTVRLALRRAGREREVRVVAERRSGSSVIFRSGDRERVLDVDSLREVIAIQVDTLGVHLDTLFGRLDSLRREVRTLRPGRVVMRMDSVVERTFRHTLPFSIEVGSRALAGAEFTQINPALGRYFHTEEGLLVLRVAPGSPAARAGLEAGDVVVRAAGEKVETLPELRRLVARARNEQVTLQVLRQGKRREVVLNRER